MANDATNGTLTPPAVDAQTSSAKRKRSDSEQLNGDGAAEQRAVQHTLAGIYDILKTHDTAPSLLDTALHSSPSADPASKRVKLSAPDTISAKIRSAAYTALRDFAADVETATSLIVSPLLAKEAVQPMGSYARLNPLSLGETRLLTGALALQKMAKGLVSNEEKLRASTAATPEVKEEQPAANGVIEIKLENGDSDALQGGGRSVLTLFGNAQGPKQLFSSLQKPASAGSVLGKRAASELDADVGVSLPIRDELLPNMISTTKVLPVQAEDATAKKRPNTIGEVFAPPPTIPALTPPKHAKLTAARGPTINWEFPSGRQKARRDSYNYTRESLSVGQWLGYRGVDVTQEPTSPEAKRKQRDRALSTGEAQPKLSEEARAAVQQAKDDALFRSVYSSFAPSRDDSGTVISAQTKDMVWWHKLGEKKFREQFAVDQQHIDPALLGEGADSTGAVANGDDDAQLKQAVENFEPEEPDFFDDADNDEPPSNDTEEILNDISELLETLNSYQRIRNATLTSTSHSRTPSMSNQQAAISNMSGTPTSPSSAEVDVYNMLKMQLLIMIKQLPPFAVAKLDGDKLADLNITKDILIETKDYKGIMEEDQVSRLAKAAALNAAVGPPSAARMGPGTGSSQFPAGTPSYNRPLGGQLGVGGVRPTSQSYFPQQQPPNRTPGMSTQRSVTGPYSTPASYPAGAAAAAARPGFASQSSFGQSAPRPGPGPAYGSAPMSASQQFLSQQQQRPGNFPQFYQNSPQAATPGRNYAQQTPSSSFQARPTGAAQQAPMYGYPASASGAQSASQSPLNRTVSPLKPNPQPPNAQPRPPYQSGAPSYGTPTAAQPNASRPPYGNSGSQPATPSGVGPSGFHTSMSNAEQQSLMERQRAQIQAQQQQRQQAERAASSSLAGSASPAPTKPTTPSGAASGDSETGEDTAVDGADVK